VKARDRADGAVAGGDAQIVAGFGDFGGGARPAEFIERHAEVDDFHLRGRDMARVDHKVGRALRDRQRDVGGRLEQSIGDLLEPGRGRQVRVFVDDGRDARRAPTRRPKVVAP
jgi:hypothetical protein